ncbi:MAG: cytochrome C [Aestuariivita sp.]|nr:cytochrome C [Aestuariivita sp.]
MTIFSLAGFNLIVAGIFFSVTSGFSGELGNHAIGRQIFSLCRGCHSIGKEAELDDNTGPHLNMIFERRPGSVPGFSYSFGLIEAAENGLTWNVETLSSFIENPVSVVPDTLMSFDGIDDPWKRQDLMAYLRLFSEGSENISDSDFAVRNYSVSSEILALSGDPEYGEYLSSECNTCHQSDRENDGIPSIRSLTEKKFVMAMHAYRDKVRSNEVMQLIAGRLSDEEIAALAAYFRESLE